MLISTRGGGGVTASSAILRGIAPDGGLYVPEALPHFTLENIRDLCGLTYPERCQRVLSTLLDDYTFEELGRATAAAYGNRFERNNPAPLRTMCGNTHLLELFHGPTLAFKDMALQLLPHLLSMALQKNGVTDEICILVATSGDTGKAALEGFCDVPGTRCVVFYPKDGVSRAQCLQMITQGGENTHVIAVEGNFDDTQTGVKRIFTDKAFGLKLAEKGRVLSSANSINYGRLAPQVAYYFSAYADLLLRKAIRPGDPVHFVVPTGNFGNILAAAYARDMGLPIDKLICASNANRVLSDFIQTGIYDVNRPFYKTCSPSMDILLSSNLERYLFELSGRDAAKVVGWMESLRREGRYSLGPQAHSNLRGRMIGGWVGNDESMNTIQRAFSEFNVMIDPHTAVAYTLLNRYRQDTGDMTQAVVVATASPYKFGHAVARAFSMAEKDDFACCRSLARMSGQRIPPQIAALESMPVRHTAVCAPEEMMQSLNDLLLNPMKKAI
ncbi:MAG: threonine synthase [Firmicutes bacterium]|nr:threonine synthase [Bacillota bacterium]